MTAVGGTTITLSGWIDDVPGALNGYDMAFPCEVVSDKPGAGDLTYVQWSVVVDWQNPDYVFFPSYPPKGPPGGCPPAPSYPYAGSAYFGPAATVPDPKYLIEVMYDVPTDAAGTYWLEVKCLDTVPPDCPYQMTHLLNNMGGTIPYVTWYGIDIIVEQGECCAGQTCTPNQTQYSCDQLGGRFQEGGDCSEIPCLPCTDCFACDDYDVCTKDLCSTGGGFCEPTCQTMFADANDDGVVNTQDVLICDGAIPGGLCANPTCDVIPACTGNGVINNADVLAVNNAISSGDPCSCPPRDCP